MKLILFSKSIRTIALVTMFSAIQGISLVNVAQAKPKTTCTAAYFDDPGYMYNPSFEKEKKLMKSAEMIARGQRSDSMIATITTFSAPLDSPMGYVVNKVNGKPVTIPPKIKQAIDRAVLVGPSQSSRKRVAELNQQYGKYATFGQNITLIPSAAQQKQLIDDTYATLADFAAAMTPQERQAERNERMAMGECSPDSLFNPKRGDMTFTIDTGTRPDLDKRLREDKTGATFFK
jgi:hypothetical protein